MYAIVYCRCLVFFSLFFPKKKVKKVFVVCGSHRKAMLKTYNDLTHYAVD